MTGWRIFEHGGNCASMISLMASFALPIEICSRELRRACASRTCESRVALGSELSGEAASVGAVTASTAVLRTSSLRRPASELVSFAGSGTGCALATRYKALAAALNHYKLQTNALTEKINTLHAENMDLRVELAEITVKNTLFLQI